MATVKKKAGRPKEDISSLDKGWEKLVIELYSEGASDVEIKSLINEMRGSFSNNLWDRWMSEEPKFWETIKRGRRLSEVWWQKKGREALENRHFNATLWYMNMKNRFSWADKQEIKQDIKHEGEIKINYNVPK
jgi:hypothetical protein